MMFVDFMVGVCTVMFGNKSGAEVHWMECKIGPLEGWVSNTATHFRNAWMAVLAAGITILPWDIPCIFTNGTVD